MRASSSLTDRARPTGVSISSQCQPVSGADPPGRAPSPSRLLPASLPCHCGIATPRHATLSLAFALQFSYTSPCQCGFAYMAPRRGFALSRSSGLSLSLSHRVQERKTRRRRRWPPKCRTGREADLTVKSGAARYMDVRGRKEGPRTRHSLRPLLRAACHSSRNRKCSGLPSFPGPATLPESQLPPSSPSCGWKPTPTTRRLGRTITVAS